MLYAIVGRDVSDSLERRLAARTEHLGRLRALLEAGRLVLAGPLVGADSPDPLSAGFAGSLIVAEFESLEEARAWVRDDPYSAEGVFTSVDVFPFVQSLP